MRRPAAAACNVIVAAAIAGCASASTIHVVRFANAPPVTVVNDRRDVPRRPAARNNLGPFYDFEGSVYRRVTRPLGVPRATRARGVNALDEVPDSTWFTNRIGIRELTPQQVHAGPRAVGSPEPHKPWTIDSIRLDDSTHGFRFTDARGLRYLLKFDSADHPELESGTAVIVNRLLWAAGYNVSEDDVVQLRIEELRIAPGATLTDKVGDTRPLDGRDLERLLIKVQRNPDGRMRALVSRLVAGAALGGHPEQGVRADDPNDRIPHELRRDLRGMYALFAWVDHVDAKESNTLDVWAADRADPRRRYVEHYLIDFGGALGSMAQVNRDKRRGHQYSYDPAELLHGTVTLGLERRSWEGRSAPELRGVGLFEARHYDPGAWHPDTPAYLPLQLADRVDKLWGAKILMRFTPAHLRAAVDAARLSDPAAGEYIVQTLLARQRATAAYWFARTSPLDRFAVVAAGRAHALCFDDLWITYGLGRAPAATRYRVASRDRTGRPLSPAFVQRAHPGGHACTPPLALARDGDGYTIVQVSTIRGGRTLDVVVHLARDPRTLAPRIIGVWRR